MTSLVFNLLVALSALEGARMISQVAEEQGVAVEQLGTDAEHFEAVQDRYAHTMQGRLLYYFEWIGGHWAAISSAAALGLAWMWRRRGLLVALAPLILNVVLLAVVFARWPTVSKIANWLN